MEDTIPMTTLNAFCRRYDLIFIELEGRGKGLVYKFIDSKDDESRYAADEIREKVALG